MRAYLLRHGEAEPTHPDADRVLTSAGQKEIEKMAQTLRFRPKLLPQRLWVSPLTRAQQTAELFCGIAGISLAPETRNDLVPNANPARTARELQKSGDSLLIVGHNPHLEILLSYLLTGRSDGLLLVLNTGSLACIEFPRFGPTPETSFLRFLLSPNLLS